MTLLEMTASAGVLILVTAAIRAFAIDRLPKRLFVALWGVVMLRLLVPFSIPLHFSLFSFTERSAYASGPSAVSTHNAELIRAARLSEQPIQPDVDLWTVLWLIGIGLAVLFFALAYLWQLRRFRYAKAVDNAFISSWLASHPLRRTVSIRESGKITAPLTYGIFRGLH